MHIGLKIKNKYQIYMKYFPCPALPVMGSCILNSKIPFSSVVFATMCKGQAKLAICQVSREWPCNSSLQGATVAKWLEHRTSNPASRIRFRCGPLVLVKDTSSQPNPFGWELKTAVPGPGDSFAKIVMGYICRSPCIRNFQLSWRRHEMTN